jgi:hypothetical protein
VATGTPNFIRDINASGPWVTWARPSHIRKPLTVLASLNVLSEPKRAQNGIPRLAKTAKEPKRFLMHSGPFCHFPPKAVSFRPADYHPVS